MNQAHIRHAVDRVCPTLLVHGHWHKRYTDVRSGVAIEGLHCNNGKFQDAVLIVDKDEDGVLTW